MLYNSYDYSFFSYLLLPFYFIANKGANISSRSHHGKELRLGSKLIGYDHYLPLRNRNNLDIFYFLMALTILGMKKNEILKNNKWAKHYINALLIAALFVPLTFVNPAAMRVINIITCYLWFQKSSILFRKEILCVFVAASTLILLLIKNNPTYMFGSCKNTRRFFEAHFSNYLNHHQVCLCNQFYNRCEEFYFIATENIIGEIRNGL